MNEELTRANEELAAYTEEDEAWDDRCRFVKNLGWLLSQTRDGVVEIELEKTKKGEFATVTYTGGGKRRINVTMDSYAAIVRDIAQKFQ